VTFRLRLAIAAAVAVAATVAIASGVIYVVMRNQLLKSADQQLVQQFAQIKRDPHSLEHAFGPDSGPFPVQPQGPSATSTYFQLVEDDGKTQKPTSELYKVPVTKETLDVASGQKRVLFANGTVGGKPARIYTVYYGRNIYNHGLAIQFVRPTDDIARTLHRLELILLLVVAGGIAAGAAGGALVSRAALVPVRRLTGAAERIARTGDPSERVADAGGPDELGRLGTAFNTMLAALEESIDTQRRFVADASHELRTPATVLQGASQVLLRLGAESDPEMVEGLRESRWALLSKVHHCMVDGVAATDLMSVMFSDETATTDASTALGRRPSRHSATG